MDGVCAHNPSQLKQPISPTASTANNSSSAETDPCSTRSLTGERAPVRALTFNSDPRAKPMGAERTKLDGLAARAMKIGGRLADGAYMAWQFAQIECSIALLAWHAAGPARSAAAHLAYCAALDREEAAARDFEELCRVTSAFATA